MPSPANYNVHHTEWRKYQEESIEWILDSNIKMNIIAAPTGSGKSCLGAALGSQGRSVMSVTPHLSLQKQYEEYGFYSLFGRSNYECIYNPLLTVNECSFSKMRECPVVSECLYIIAKNQFIQAERGSLNYAYYLNAGWLKDFPKDWIVLDEAHEISRYLMDYLALDFTAEMCMKYDLPFWKPRKEVSSQGIARVQAVDWVYKCLVNIQNDIERFTRIAAGNPNMAIRVRNLQQLFTKFSHAQHGIERDPDEWYISIDKNHIKIAPLSAKPYFNEYFVDGFFSKFLLMSATIGNPKSFAESLGIESYRAREVPSRFPPKTRPVWDLGAPKMSYGVSELAYSKQADLIARAIKSVPDDWSGIIHANSISKSNALADRLARRGLQDRVYVVEGRGTMNKLDNWRKRKQKVPNSLAISYSFGQGVDLGDEKINISADVPFASLADPVERARASRYNNFYVWAAALGLEQRNGRTRRGRLGDYDTDTEMAGLNAIADSNYLLCQDHFSKDFKQCLRTL